ncbi:MAG: NADH-quinone oxidoreductase subunit C [Terriglobia bacterium]
MPEESLTLSKLRENFANNLIEVHSFRGDDTALIQPEALLPLMTYLKTTPELNFDMLMDLSAVDCLGLGKPYRFEVVYHLFSISLKHRIRIKVPAVAENPEVDSLASLWPVANWFEREVWDMFGVRFRGHPNLKRILMYEEFEGHPLRRDYPVNKRQPLVGPGSKA